MDSDKSVLILNLGLHYVHTINFTTYMGLIDKTIRLLNEKFKTNKKSWRFRGQLIWKTTTAINKEKYGDPRTNARHSTSIRFLTYQVRWPQECKQPNFTCAKPLYGKYALYFTSVFFHFAFSLFLETKITLCKWLFECYSRFEKLFARKIVKGNFNVKCVTPQNYVLATFISVSRYDQ